MLEPAHQGVAVGYVVGDLDAMTAFYADGLGLEQIGEETLPDDYPGGGRTMRSFAAGTSVLKLWALHAGRPPRGADERLGELGMRYITLQVTDLYGLVQRLDDAGYVIATPPRRSALGAPRSVSFVRDPDGNFIELIEVHRSA